jgi:hypothetical protein
VECQTYRVANDDISLFETLNKPFGEYGSKGREIEITIVVYNILVICFGSIMVHNAAIMWYMTNVWFSLSVINIGELFDSLYRLFQKSEILPTKKDFPTFPLET